MRSNSVSVQNSKEFKRESAFAVIHSILNQKKGKKLDVAGILQH